MENKKFFINLVADLNKMGGVEMPESPISDDQMEGLHHLMNSDRLTDREKQVMQALYMQDLSITETGEKLDLSEMRVSQLRKELLQKLSIPYYHNFIKLGYNGALAAEKAAQATPYEGVDRGIRLDSTPLPPKALKRAHMAGVYTVDELIDALDSGRAKSFRQVGLLCLDQFEAAVAPYRQGRSSSGPLTAEAQYAARLKQLRKEKGVSARDMSLALNLSDSYINRVEKGMMLPSLPMFFAICDYFHIAPADWFDTTHASAQTHEALAKLNMLTEEERKPIFALIDILARKEGAGIPGKERK